MKPLLLLSRIIFSTSTLAQSCFYPNGNSAASEGAAPCGTRSQCCPLNWVCLSNGLCSYPPSNYLGRYSCADKSWKDPTCPSYCLKDNNSGGGNQAVLKCPNGKYCCDGDRVSFDCCSKEGVDFFSLPEGQKLGTIKSVATGVTTATTDFSSTSKSSAIDMQTTRSSTARSRSASISDTSSGTTIYLSGNSTVPLDPHPPTRVSSNSWQIILGIVFGVLGLVLLIGLAHFFLRRRGRKRKADALEPATRPVSDHKKRISERVSWLMRSPRAKSPASLKEENARRASPVNELHGAPVAIYPDAIELPADPPTPKPGNRPTGELTRQDTYGQLMKAPPQTCVPFNTSDSAETAPQHPVVSQSFHVQHPASTERSGAAHSRPGSSHTRAVQRASAVSSLTPSEQGHPNTPMTSPQLYPSLTGESVTAWQQHLPALNERSRAVSGVSSMIPEDRPFSVVSLDLLDSLRAPVHELPTDGGKSGKNRVEES